MIEFAVAVAVAVAVAAVLERKQLTFAIVIDSTGFECFH
jgi:hypothetical protein